MTCWKPTAACLSLPAMFSGIITDIGRVRAVATAGETRLVIATRYPVAEIAIGASIACSGVCLTVIETGIETGTGLGAGPGGGWFAATASAETLARTTIGAWRPGTPVNLERALRLGDEFGGHIVLGHVDALARVVERREEGGSLRLAFEAPAELARSIAPKGSVALDGVSLTVNEVAGARFGVNLIPHTRSATTLGAVRPGDRVNLEIDPLARYVQRLLQSAGAGAG